MSELVAQDLACVRGDRLIWRDLSVHLRAGQGLAVMGANGCGKSSLLAALAGFIPLLRGTVRVDSQPLSATAFHWLGHHDGLPHALTAQEVLQLWQSLFSSSAPFEAITEKLGLAQIATMRVTQLSAGQKRRLALARFLIQPRPLWLMDEPTAALDDDAQAVLAHYVQQHRQAGGMVIAATHDRLPWPDLQTLTLQAAA